MKVPLSNLSLQHKEIRKEINKAINNVIKRNDFILGNEVNLFEKEFADFCSSQYAVGVSSGTAALFLALKSLDIKEGDEVIVPVFTFIATAFAVSYTGAKPVFVDIEERTYNIDVKKIEKAITKNTKAIIPVHLFGQPADMAEILKIAKVYNLKVIEDAAQAHGAEIRMSDNKWLKVGSLQDIGCFSFFPSKNLGAMGDAGAIVTNQEQIYKKLLILRNCGRVAKYEHRIIGYNARLDTLQAAILRIKLKKLDTWNKMRQRAADIYNELLKDIEGIIIPYAGADTKHVYHAYAIRTKKRDELLEKLKDRSIGTAVYYPKPLHLQEAYSGLGYKAGDFPVAEKISQEIISLPMYAHIKKAQIKSVVKTVKETLGR
jgi:dTDP-4-amino-4,6-dideoxygalactose transaminase